eukprot:gene14055-21471_t
MSAAEAKGTESVVSEVKTVSDILPATDGTTPKN